MCVCFCVARRTKGERERGRSCLLGCVLVELVVVVVTKLCVRMEYIWLMKGVCGGGGEGGLGWRI